ncbi:hypothetical protein LG52_85 [Geobacillus kaustophilus]|uniref:Uncharacterized protein n=1 Tax=Geobacillus kaustophilus TaxID=1462 RepID=A0A0D8BWA6_GEOKU|nr:hypothetical protein [Geobacillus kaustophilus]KJE28481.1 hypothetical protein LG52_85 [Geobacillus kaustophilus]
MFISPLTLLPGSRQCFLFFVTKSQNLVMNQKYNMIHCKVEDFVVGLGKGEKMPNTYFTNEPTNFTNNAKQYQKRKVMSVYTYYKQLEEKQKLAMQIEEQMNMLQNKN